MSRTTSKQTDKFTRVFEQIDELKIEVAELRTKNEVEEKSLEKIEKKIDLISATLNQIVGRESVRAGIYGVIGSIVSGLVVWIVTLIRGS